MSDQWYGDKSYSQHGEDLAIVNIFRLLENYRPSYLDVGAHHPTRISNTALLYSRGSRGVNVEANPNLIQAFKTQRPGDINLNVGVSVTSGVLPFYMIDKTSGRNTFNKSEAEQFVKDYPQFKISEILNINTLTLPQIVGQCPNGVFPDFLSIDIEGQDYGLLQSVDFSVSSPKVICVEVQFGDS